MTLREPDTARDSGTAPRAALVEVYVPVAGATASAGVVTIVDRIVTAERGGAHLYAAAHLPNEELLLLLFDPGPPAAVARLLAAAGVDPIRATSCRHIRLPPRPE